MQCLQPHRPRSSPADAKRERESEEFTQFERRCFAGLVACRIFSIAVGMLAFAHCMFPAYL